MIYSVLTIIVVTSMFDWLFLVFSVAKSFVFTIYIIIII